MLDLSHIPNSQQDINIFYSNGITNSWQTWTKPRKCQWVWIMAIGGGASGTGGAGPAGAFFSPGGGSGAQTRALFNASHLPDTLYIQVGLGGQSVAGGSGGSAGTTGLSGSRSYVSILPNITVTNLVCISGAIAAIGNVAGSSANGETATTAASANFLTLANFISTSGGTSVGLSLSQPVNLTPSVITSPGAGGAGWVSPSTVYNGASILSSSISPLIVGGTANPGTSGGDGAHGVTSWKPFYSTGGAGGASSFNSTGGKGGNGGIGSGGGGGGAGPSGGGSSGKGGDGIVFIICF